VINASYGSYKPSECEKEAIAYAQRKDTLIVAAAGNDDQDSDVAPSYPADYDFDNIISVAASTSADKLASFSNYGNKSVDLAAPGVEIASTWKGSDYRYLSGTSMATPFVTASAALLRKAGDGLPYTRIRKLLLSNVDKSKAFKQTTVTGGRLNAARALADV
jgi:subtilisin family serine protease